MAIQQPGPNNLQLMTIIAVAIGFFSASQDIATVQLEVAGVEKGKRIKFKLKYRHILKGQIRIIKPTFRTS
jgi:hypothetical protein